MGAQTATQPLHQHLSAYSHSSRHQDLCLCALTTAIRLIREQLTLLLISKVQKYFKIGLYIHLPTGKKIPFAGFQHSWNLTAPFPV